MRPIAGHKQPHQQRRYDLKDRVERSVLSVYHCVDLGANLEELTIELISALTSGIDLDVLFSARIDLNRTTVHTSNEAIFQWRLQFRGSEILRQHKDSAVPARTVAESVFHTAAAAPAESIGNQQPAAFVSQ
jgi:protein-arginine kinase